MVMCSAGLLKVQTGIKNREFFFLFLTKKCFKNAPDRLFWLGNARHINFTNVGSFTFLSFHVLLFYLLKSLLDLLKVVGMPLSYVLYGNLENKLG